MQGSKADGHTDHGGSSFTGDLQEGLSLSSVLSVADTTTRPDTCRAAKQMDTLTKEVAVPLGTYMKGFPPVQRLHPFEQAMLELTWGTQTYERVLSKVDSLRKSILEAKPAPWLCMIIIMFTHHHDDDE